MISRKCMQQTIRFVFSWTSTILRPRILLGDADSAERTRAGYTVVVDPYGAQAMSV